LPPKKPPSPFKNAIDCFAAEPNIKGLEIGFDFNIWRVNELIEYSSEWLIDYSLSASQKASIADRPRKQMKMAIDQFNIQDINVISDLFLHMAIRTNYKTIPIVNKVINTKVGSAFSCSHVVLDKGRLEIWLGASTIEKNLNDAVITVVKNINTLINIDTIKERLILITSEMDDSWPFKEKLTRISDNNLPLQDRFDKIIVPVFIAHNSEMIKPYLQEQFINSFQQEINSCRELINQEYSNQITALIDLRVFVFPVEDIDLIHKKFMEELVL
jgi:hypothetical protein